MCAAVVSLTTLPASIVSSIASSPFRSFMIRAASNSTRPRSAAEVADQMGKAALAAATAASTSAWEEAATSATAQPVPGEKVGAVSLVGERPPLM
jgi:hypothetical protein